MLGIGFQEIVVIVILALIIFGPQKLPELARILGRGMREFRRAADDFRFSIEQEEQKSQRKKPDEPVISYYPDSSNPATAPIQKKPENHSPESSERQNNDQPIPNPITPHDPNNREVMILEKHG